MILPSKSGFLALCLAFVPAAAQSPAVTSVRFWTLGEVTRVAIEVSADFTYRSDKLTNPDRLFFDIKGASLRLPAASRGIQTISVGSPMVKQIRVAQTRPDISRIVLDLTGPFDHTVSKLETPSRLIIEVRAAADKPVLTPPPTTTSSAPLVSQAAPTPVPPPALTPAAVIEPPLPTSATPLPVAAKPVDKPIEKPLVETVASLPSAVPATRNSNGGRSLTRVLGLKIGKVVLDPGHGGHDHGTTGPGGLTEKDLVLDVALRLGQLIESRLGSEVVYTRKDDKFIPLDERTAIANRNRADLFLSIHANSSPYPTAAGIETYYLNFTNSKLDLEVAARENAGHDKSVYELSNILERIAKQDKRDESREFATKVQASLFPISAKLVANARNRGVKKAPFIVLIGASMPSVLTEIGFVTNRKEESELKTAEYRQKVAEALFRGLAGYAATLSHFSIAQRGD
ncbi:MAG: N-acetylmuramoyl-L-alanine amidase [Bryobacteraceae bacterium]